MRRGGGIGIVTILVLVVVGWVLGINPLYLIGGAEILSRLGGGTSRSRPSSAGATARPAQPTDQMQDFVAAVLGSTEAQWQEIFARAGKTYRAPTLVMFSGSVRSACGFAQAAMGPFYCPNDQKVYLDTSFFEDLERRFRGCDPGSRNCQFAQAYVITHEVGHHVQNLLGLSCRRSRNCSAGWGRPRPTSCRFASSCRPTASPASGRIMPTRNGGVIEPGDVEAAMQTASAIGDDRLQRRTQGYVVPDAFTHGSSEQRVRWFMTGLKSGQTSRAAIPSRRSSSDASVFGGDAPRMTGTHVSAHVSR